MLSEPPGLRIELLTDARGDLVLRLCGELDADTASLLTTDAEQMVLGIETSGSRLCRSDVLRFVRAPRYAAALAAGTA